MFIEELAPTFPPLPTYILLCCRIDVLIGLLYLFYLLYTGQSQTRDLNYYMCILFAPISYLLWLNTYSARPFAAFVCSVEPTHLYKAIIYLWLLLMNKLPCHHSTSSIFSYLAKSRVWKLPIIRTRDCILFRILYFSRCSLKCRCYYIYIYTRGRATDREISLPIIIFISYSHPFLTC